MVVVDIEQGEADFILEQVVAKLHEYYFRCINFFIIWVFVTNKRLERVM